MKQIKFDNINILLNNKMKLRSGREYIYNMDYIYEVNIDFDEASRMWRNNKISIGEGQFIYI